MLQHYKGGYFNPYANSLSQDHYKKQGEHSEFGKTFIFSSTCFLSLTKSCNRVLIHII